MINEQEESNEVKPEIRIRAAHPDDAEQLAVIYKEAWQATYPNAEYGIAQEDIEEKTKDWGTPEDIRKRRERIQNSDDHVYDVVAEADGCVIGDSVFIRTSGNKYNKLAKIYVHPEYHGMGAGTALAREGLRWLGDEKPVALEVTKYNEQAIGFYQKLGFEIVGDGKSPVAELPSGVTIPEYLMVKDVPGD